MSSIATVGVGLMLSFGDMMFIMIVFEIYAYVSWCTTILFGTMLGLQEEYDLATHFPFLPILCRLCGDSSSKKGLGLMYSEV